MNQTHILLVEDDKDIQTMLSEYLEKEGFLITIASDGQEALHVFHQQPDVYHVILLDLMLPLKNGAEVLKEIRQTSIIPVIIISAKEDEFDKMVVLEMGADDYVTKPFSLLELKSRIMSNIRRATIYNKDATTEQILTHLDLKLNSSDFSVYRADEPITLTKTEFMLLELFMKHPKRVFTKDEIYERVWNETYYGDEHIVNVHMSRLREKIEKNPKSPQYLQTIWGIGYRLKEIK